MNCLFDKRKIDVLSKYDERELLIKYKEHNCEESLEKLIIHNKSLVYDIALKINAGPYDKPTYEFQDLLQVGIIGFVRGVDKFNLNTKHKLSTYAIWWISHHIKRFVIDNKNIIRVPSYIHEKIYKINKKLKDDIFNSIKSNVKEEVENLTDMSVKQYEHIVSINNIVSLDNKTGDFVEDFYSTVENGEDTQDVILEKNEMNFKLNNLMDTVLNEKEKFILVRRLGLNLTKTMTLEQIGVELSVTRERIRQLEKQAINKLKKYTKKHNIKFEDFFLN